MKLKEKVAFFGCILLFTFFTSQTLWAITEGEAFPNSVVIKAYKDGELNQQKMIGRVTIVNFWATWCESCKVELVEMEDKFSPLLTHKDVQLAFVSLDKDPDKAGGWFSGHLKKPDAFIKFLYKDPEFVAAETLGFDSFPMTLVIDKEGVVKYVQKGYQEGTNSTEKIVDFTKKLLGL